MSDIKKFYDLGKMVGLNKKEVDEVRPSSFKVLIIILILVIASIIGALSFNYIIQEWYNPDPYGSFTLYSTIEPKFSRKLNKLRK